MQSTTRRSFLEFMGRSVVGGVGLATISPFIGCASKQSVDSKQVDLQPSLGLKASRADELLLAEGLSYHILAKWQDVLNNRGEKFGSHSDFLSYLPFKKENPNEGYLWVNHEYYDPRFVSGFERHQKLEEKTIEQARNEQKEVGGSILHIKKDETSGKWSVVPMSSKNQRFDARTEIPFAGGRKVFGSTKAIGTMGNCCGGLTPWGTFLTCEENFQQFYGSTEYDEKGQRKIVQAKHPMAWDRQFQYPPEHYGWVCEINPKNGKIVKHVSLGRFAHEGATVAATSKNHAVVYMGDDMDDEHFYKFVADKPNQLITGKLYVAKMNQNPGVASQGKGEWIEISLQNPLLKGKFKDHTELMVRVREASKIVGATPLDRPEDCDIDPLTQNIYLACTNNSSQKRLHGYLLKIKEQASSHDATRFEWDVFMKGGEGEMSCPDNLAFDAQGNLWIATDMSEFDTEIYGKFGNNSLFYCPTQGENAGKAIRVAVAPRDAEFTGIWFGADKHSLFMSIQHPGSASKSTKPQDLTSHWPDGGQSIPKSSVVVVQGSLISEVMHPHRG